MSRGSYNSWMCPPEDDTHYETCFECDGTGVENLECDGEIVPHRCERCNGEGQIESEPDGDAIYEAKFDK